MTGSLGFVQVDKNSSMISKSIVFFERLRARKKFFSFGEARTSHVFGFKNDCSIIETHMFQGVREKPISVYKNKKVRIFKPKFLSFVIKDNMKRMLPYLTGDSYGITKIPLLALDNIFDTYFFSKTFGITDFKVCNQLWAWIYKKVPIVYSSDDDLYNIAKGKFDHQKELGYEFGCHWKQTNPDIMEDFVSQSKDWIEK